MNLPIPQLVKNEFEMAIDTGLIAVIGSCDARLTHAEFGLLLLKRIGAFNRECPELPTGGIVREAVPDCSDADHGSIANTLEMVYSMMDVNVCMRIRLLQEANGLEDTLSKLLVEPVLPFQIFPVGGAETLDERIRKATDGSAAYDIIAQDDIVVTAEAQLIKLGFKTRMDYRHAALLLPRSGHGAKWGLSLANTVGLIDADYPDEWMAKIYLNDISGINDEKEPLLIPKGERLAQFLIVEPKHPVMELEHDEANLRATGRTGGFGSTNVHGESKPS
jgi:dUTP pyrophosphatase